MPKVFRLLFAMIVRENSPTSPKNLFNQFRDELASDYRHNRDNTNGPYIESDYNEALWSIDDILRRRHTAFIFTDVVEIFDFTNLVHGGCLRNMSSMDHNASL